MKPDIDPTGAGGGAQCCPTAMPLLPGPKDSRQLNHSRFARAWTLARQTANAANNQHGLQTYTAPPDAPATSALQAVDAQNFAARAR